MKALYLLAAVCLFLGLESTYAGGCTGGPQKCMVLTLPTSVAIAVSAEEGKRLWDDLEKLGIEEVLAACEQKKDATKISEISGSLCGSNVRDHRICNFTSTLVCRKNGKQFESDVGGACKGDLHDCGTFKSCARDVGFRTYTANNFRGESDPVPKVAPGEAK